MVFGLSGTGGSNGAGGGGDGVGGGGEGDRGKRHVKLTLGSFKQRVLPEEDSHR